MDKTQLNLSYFDDEEDLINFLFGIRVSPRS